MDTLYKRVKNNRFKYAASPKLFRVIFYFGHKFDFIGYKLPIWRIYK